MLFRPVFYGCAPSPVMIDRDMLRFSSCPQFMEVNCKSDKAINGLIGLQLRRLPPQ